MNKDKDNRKIWQVSLWITGMIILLLFTIIWYRVVAFDTNEMSVNGEMSNATVSFVPGGGGENADSWETDIRFSDEEEDVAEFIGTTFSCKVVNDNHYNVKDWELRIDIKNECFLSGFWCGSFEVHQFRGAEELVSMIPSQSSDISGMNIDCNKYTDTMMVRLLPGDYLIYFPSAREKEDIVKASESIGIGFIFYYQENMDLSNWIITYHNDLKMSGLTLTKVVIFFAVLWICAFAVYVIVGIMSRRIKDEMNKRIRNVSIMTDLYLEAYMIDVDADAAVLIKGKDDELVMNLAGDNVQEKLNAKILSSCQEQYADDLHTFLDLSTVMERMGDSSSITFEFIDKSLGWIAIRLFRAGDDKVKNQIVLTMQDLNEEKERLGAIEARMSLAEYKQSVSGSFLETVSFALNTISEKILTYGQCIISENDPENMKILAESVMLNTKHMNLIQNTMLDLYEIESKRLKLNIEPYSIFDVADEIYRILEPYADEKAFEFKVEIDETIPSSLKGDSKRIEQILIILLFSEMIMTQEGFVKFSIFGKRDGNSEELLFSLRDSAQGFSEAQLNEMREFINGSRIETFDNASLVYLKIINGILIQMGSELKIVSVLGEGTDFYFTIKQEIVK